MPKNILKSSPTLLFPRVPHRTHWWDGVTQALWEGQVEDVIAACQALAAACELARKAAHYFYIHAERMRYDSLPSGWLYDRQWHGREWL